MRIINPETGKLTEYSLNVISDYGSLVVTEGLGKDPAHYVVTHKATTMRVRAYNTLSKANAAAEAWAELSCWDFTVANARAKAPAIQEELTKTVEWKGGE